MADARKTILIDVKGNAQKALAGISTKALAATAAFAGLGAALKDATAQYAEMDAAQGRLDRSMKRAGATAKEMAAAQDLIRQNMENLGVGIQEQTDALRGLLDVTKDMHKAREGLTLAIDIAAQKDIDLSAAAEKVQKVYQGEVEVLKELGVLTKNQAEELAKVTDESQRTALAIYELEKSFRGAAEENKGFIDRMATTREKAEEVKREVGNVTAALGDAATGLIGSLIAAATGGKDAADGMETFRKTLKSTASDIREATGDINAFVQGLGELSYRDVVNMGLSGGAFNLENYAKIVDKGRTAQANAGRGRVSDGFISGPQIVKDVAPSAPVGGGKKTPPRSPTVKPKPKDPKDRPVVGQRKDRIAELHAETAAIEEAEQKRQQALRESAAAYNELTRAQNAVNEKQAEQAEEDAIRKRADAQAKLKEAEEAKRDAAFAAADAAKGIADQFIESEAAKAAISAAIETARSIAAFATGNIPGGIGHAAAAAQFGIVASMSGGSSAPPAKGGGGSGAASSPTSSTFDREAGGAFGRGLGGESKDRGGLTIVVNAHSVSKLTNEEARSIARSLRREMRSRA